jgi:DNA polymerase-3 subunit epsilon
MNNIKVIVPSIINVGGNEIILNDEQNAMLSEKIKLFGTEGMETKAYIVQIIDENKNSDSIPIDRKKKAIQDLNLQKPIIFFDTETTGLDVGVDRIVSIAVTKIKPDGEIISKSYLINPMIQISKEASEIHGITNEMLVDKPKFSQLAKSMYEFMQDSYLAGYNNNYFDNQILQEEFLRCGIEYPPYDIVSVDACAIFKTYEKRDLTSALKFYCNKDMENAHDATADTHATLEIFLGQIKKYDDLKTMPIEEIAKIGKAENQVDFASRILKDADGDYIWNFGKPKGRKIKNEMGFGDWVLTNQFPQTFKNLVSKILIELRTKK